MRTISHIDSDNNEEDENTLTPGIKESKYKIFMSREKKARF